MRTPQQILSDLADRLANPVAKREQLVAELSSNPYYNEAGARQFLRAQGVTQSDVDAVVSDVGKLRALKSNLILSDALGAVLKPSQPQRAFLMAQVKNAPHMNAAIIRDRLKLHGVTNEEIEKVVAEFEQKG
jgi:hypothetical protein